MKPNAPAARPSQTWKSSRKFHAEAKRLGSRIRAMRQAQGLTLAEASRRMDVDLHHLQKVETGSLNVTLVTLVRIVHGLGEPFCALCGEEHGAARRNGGSTLGGNGARASNKSARGARANGSASRPRTADGARRRASVASRGT